MIVSSYSNTAELDGTFLIRESGQDYVLSLVYESRVYHYKIQPSGNVLHFYGQACIYRIQ